MQNCRNVRKQLGIYIHIPFCVRKCAYCDFLSAPAPSPVREAYVQELLREIASFEAAPDYEAVSVFIGGGTPSILEGEQLERILKAVRRRFAFASVLLPDLTSDGKNEEFVRPDRKENDEHAVPFVPEITVECNPGTLTGEKLKTLSAAGVNRLSLGLQSGSEEELRLLGRIHTWDDFRKNYELARETGFSNINVDLMSGLPSQTVASWQETLRKVLALKPEHISAYSLIIEEGTAFYGLYHREDELRAKGRETDIAHRCLPAEEEEREMYQTALRLMEAAGLRRYEISNYARPGFESVHNLGYWTRREYIGFGLGASSQIDHLRWKNTVSLEEYLAGDHGRREEIVLSEKDAMEETMFLGLRMMDGVSVAGFTKCFGVSPLQVYEKVLPRLCALELISAGERICLTEKGIDVSNQVMAEFLL